MRKYFFLILFFLISISLVSAGDFVLVENGNFELGTLDPFIVGEGNYFNPTSSKWNVNPDMNWDQSVKDWDTLVNTSDMNGIYNIKAIGLTVGAGEYAGFIYHPDFGSHTSPLDAGRIKVTLKDYSGFQNIVFTGGGVSAIDGNNVLWRACQGVGGSASLSTPVEFIIDFNNFIFSYDECISATTPYPVIAFNLNPAADILGIDNIYYASRDSLKLTISEPDGDPVETGAYFNIHITVQNSTDLNYLENGSCDMYFNYGDKEDMNNIGSGVYTYLHRENLAGSFDYTIKCSIPEYADTNAIGSIRTQLDLSDYLTITPINNISSYSVDFNGVRLNLSNENNDFSFKVESSYPNPIDVEFYNYNSRTDEKQYFIYTATPTEYTNGTWVFDDTLTFGTTNSNPVQKIWYESDSRYKYSINDNLTNSEINYYEFRYRSPHRHYFSIHKSNEWLETLEPNVIDNNAFAIDEYTISQFANIRSILIENIPEIFEDEESAFEFQFTAYSNTAGTVLSAGKTLNGTDTIESVTLTTEPHTYSFTITSNNFNDQLLLVSTDGGTSSNIYITDYSIVARGFFTKRLEILKKNRNPLDVMLISNFSQRYLREGIGFYLLSGAYDREGDLSRLELEAFLDSNASINKVKTTTISIDLDAEEHYNFDELMPPVIDLNGTASNPATPRLIILKANLYDANGTRVATQSETVRFVQYPYFPNDLTMYFFPTEKRLGKNPAGLLEINISEADVLEGLDIRIYSDTNTVTDPNYRTTLYKNQDFTCESGLCSFQITVDDYIFEDVNQTHITIFALLNTEYLDTSNYLTRVDRTIYITTIEFDIAKIYQVMHREDRTYTENEEIPIVLILRDDEATNIYNKIDVYVTLDNCNDANGSFCASQTTKWKPTGFIYDDKFNLNYYFFRHLYLLDNGTLLPDSNYIGFHAHVTDQTGITSSIVPVLTDRCKWNTIDTTNFWTQLSSYIVGTWDALTSSITGCTEEQYAIVTTTTNNNQEARLLIDEDHAVNSPSQELFACVSPDQNNIYSEPLKQELVCVTWYESAEKPIDNFRLRITNGFSDLTNTDDTKQYVEFNIPYEIVAMNDLVLLKKQLETQQNTTIDTVGEFIFEGLRLFVRDSFFTDKLNDYDSFLLGSGLITNIGADLNMNKAFSPANVTGIAFYKIKGLSVINANDYRFTLGENFEKIDRKQLLNYFAENNINYTTKQAELELIINDFTVPVKFIDNKGSLVIDEEPITTSINQTNIDTNANYNYIPNILSFTLQNTMFFNNFSENDTRTIILTVLTQVKDTGINSVIQLFQDFGNDPTGTITNFLFASIFIIAIIMALIFMVSLVYRNFAGRDR